MEIKEEESVYPVEALQVLQARDEEELNHEQKITLENLTRHCKVKDIDTLEEIHSELEEIEPLKEKHIYKLLEVVPQFETSVRAIFSKERVKLDDNQVEQILDICKSIETED